MRDDDVERRMSVRQSECAYRYKEIVVKKCNKYTQIWLNTHTKMKNSLNPQVCQLNTHTKIKTVLILRYVRPPLKCCLFCIADPHYQQVGR